MDGVIACGKDKSVVVDLIDGRFDVDMIVALLILFWRLFSLLCCSIVCWNVQGHMDAGKGKLAYRGVENDKVRLIDLVLDDISWPL